MVRMTACWFCHGKPIRSEAGNKRWSCRLCGGTGQLAPPAHVAERVASTSRRHARERRAEDREARE